jgi:hypothetical protein
MKCPKDSEPLHPRYDGTQPLLRDIVSVQVDTNNGVSFYIHLTRVPCIGEAIEYEGEYYRVLRVFHSPVNDDGRARFGWHAMIDAEHWPEDHVPPIKHEAPKRRSAMPF